ncbi:MAG: hypothetical protein Q8914_02695 [Bacteroidota bacterium]|nr:hypothetical protein [Bacteroidota bacterium]
MKKGCELRPRPKSVKEFFTSWYFWKPFLGVLLGGLAGFLYYYFIGCSSGSCPITGNPYMSILWGSLFGLFLTIKPCCSGGCN